MNNEGYIEDQTLKDKLFNTEGRLNRMRYFKRCLLLLAITVVCYVVVGVALSDDYGNMTGRTEMGLLVVGLVGSFAGYCLNLRRMQDIGSGNAKKIALAFLAIDVLLCFDISESISIILGVISLPVALYMLFCPGTVGPNEYGPDPLGAQITGDVSDTGVGNDMQGDMIDLPTSNLNANSNSGNQINNIQTQDVYSADSSEDTTSLGIDDSVINVADDEEVVEETSDDKEVDDDDDDDDGPSIMDLF